MTKRAVVLARGLGRRMRAADPDAVLTPDQQRAADAGHKALMPVAGRPFIDYLLESLEQAGLEQIALVVAPDHDEIRAHVERYSVSLIAIDLVVQTEPRGTADAVLSAESWTSGEPFLVLNSDNLYPVDAVREVAALDEPGLPVFARDELAHSSNIPPERVQAFAIVEIDAAGYLVRIVEKPDAARVRAAGPSAPVSMNCWRFDARIFDFCRRVPLSERGELELPQAVDLACRNGVRFRALPAHGPVLDLSRRSDAADLARRLQPKATRP
jgi:glucose-1-phosphate thymidylyltransferase